MTVNHLRIKAERVAKGLTQDDMAKALGWSDRARYAKRENGLVSFDADAVSYTHLDVYKRQHLYS